MQMVAPDHVVVGQLSAHLTEGANTDLGNNYAAATNASLPKPAANDSKRLEYHVKRLRFVMVDNAAMPYTGFGAIVGALTNGIILQYQRTTGAPFAPQVLLDVPLKLNPDFGRLDRAFTIENDGVNYKLTAVWELDTPLVVEHDNANSFLRAVLQDNLSTLVSLEIVAEGDIVQRMAA